MCAKWHTAVCGEKVGEGDDSGDYDDAHTSNGTVSEVACEQIIVAYCSGSPYSAVSEAVSADTLVSLGSFCGTTALSQKRCEATCI